MKTATRTITGKTIKGQSVEIIVTRTVSTHEISLDGFVTGSKETTILTSIKMTIDGKTVASNCIAPTKLDPKLDKSSAQYIAAGAYARIDNKTCINETRYNEIMAAIAEMDAELEIIPVAAPVATEIVTDSDLCPKCGSHCYGDCTAN
jgi:hypothetical protein